MTSTCVYMYVYIYIYIYIYPHNLCTPTPRNSKKPASQIETDVFNQFLLYFCMQYTLDDSTEAESIIHMTWLSTLIPYHHLSHIPSQYYSCSSNERWTLLHIMTQLIFCALSFFSHCSSSLLIVVLSLCCSRRCWFAHLSLPLFLFLSLSLFSLSLSPSPSPSLSLSLSLSFSLPLSLSLFLSPSPSLSLSLFLFLFRFLFISLILSFLLNVSFISDCLTLVWFTPGIKIPKMDFNHI